MARKLSPYRVEKNKRMQALALALYKNGDFSLRELAKQMETIYGFKKSKDWYRMAFEESSKID